MYEEALLSYLRKLYAGAGFRAYKMRKFEEYSLYLENRDFLLSDQIITFSDMSGRLLALKPDVTLSIVKGSRATKEKSEKLYYTESVYRLDSRTNEYREIRQMGLEALGDIDGVQTLEVVSLALKSLVAIDERALMDISHMGYLKPFLNGASGDERKEILSALRAKNAVALKNACAGSGMQVKSAEALLSLISLSGDFSEGLSALSALSQTEEQKKAAEELKELYEGLKSMNLHMHVRLDFSIANDLSYYTGIVFQGYVRNAHRAVLSGGRYDGLTQKFKRGAGAMGFAVYLNELNPKDKENQADADVLIVYEEGASAEKVLKEAQKYRDQGMRVRIEKTKNDDYAYTEIVEVKREC